MDQDRNLWDRLLIGRGLAALQAARTIGGARGVYEIQAQIAACHARASRAEDTNFSEIVSLYNEFMRIAPSPIVELNRAVAVGMSEGPAVALVLVDALVRSESLKNYHLLGAVRADLLTKLGRSGEARNELLTAAELTPNECQKSLLLQRAQSLMM